MILPKRRQVRSLKFCSTFSGELTSQSWVRVLASFRRSNASSTVPSDTTIRAKSCLDSLLSLGDKDLRMNRARRSASCCMSCTCRSISRYAGFSECLSASNEASAACARGRWCHEQPNPAVVSTIHSHAHHGRVLLHLINVGTRPRSREPYQHTL